MTCSETKGKSRRGPEAVCTSIGDGERGSVELAGE
jgi:hypothetical protein